MSDIRVDLEAFIAGDLDYGELQRRLSEHFSGGETPARAREILEGLREAGGVPQGLYNVLSRSIERYRESPEEITDPILDDTVEEPPPPPAEDYPIELDEALLPAVYAEEPPEERPPEPRPRGKAPRPGRVPPPPEIRLLPEEEEAGEAAGEAKESAAGGPPAASPSSAGAPPPGKGAPPAASAVSRTGLPQPEEVLAERYELGEITGRGGMGVVFRAVDRLRTEAGARETAVAVKVLRPELQGKPLAESRLMAEALKGQALRHRNLVRVFDVGRDGGRVFVVMEQLEGESLRNRIIRGGPEGMDRAEGRRILAGVLEAVAYIHDQGFVHGDLKPGNVFLTRDGEPKLLDFGLTRRADRESMPALEAVVPTPGRTPAYSSVERLTGRPPDKRDDVYALGCIAYEVLSGKHPYGKKPADEARREKLRPAPVRGLSPRQWRTLQRALDFNGRRRPRDAGRMLEGLGFRPPGSGRPVAGFLPGLLAGVAAGAVLALVLIHPGGPLGRALDPAAQPPAGAPEGAGTPAPAAATGEPAAEPDAGAGPRGATGEGGVFRPEPGVPDAETPAAADPEASAPDTDLPQTPGPATTQPAASPASGGPGRIAFAAPLLRVDESRAAAVLELVRTGGTAGRVGLRWRTVPDSAREGEDYIGGDWQGVAFADGQTRARIFVPLVNDGIREPTEGFFVEIADPEGGAGLGSVRRARVEITDDD